MDVFVSKYVREQRRYTKNELRAIFSLSEDAVINFVQRLKAFGVLKTVKKTPNQIDLSDLSEEDLAITDDMTNGNDCYYVFSFVGVLTIGNRVIKCFPKYIKSVNEPEDDLKQTIKVLQRYGSKEQIINMYNGDADSGGFNLLAIMLFILDDYHTNGVYTNTEDIVEINGEGPILWEQTINSGFTIVSNNRPYYVDLYTHRVVDDDDDFFHRLHSCVISECSNQLQDAGILELFDMIPADTNGGQRSELGDDDYLLYKLQSELNVQFNTHKQIVLKTLYAYIAHNRTLAENYGISMYGTTSFNLVWEDVCKQVFADCLQKKLRNIPLPNGVSQEYSPTLRLIDVIEKPKWTGTNEEGISFTKEANETLIPDLISIYHSNEAWTFFIFDAKYYCIQLECNKTLSGQPGVGDVTKQYLYQLAYDSFITSHGLTCVRNCFLMPTEEDCIIKKGVAHMNMLSNLGLQPIKIRLLPARRMYELYLARHVIDIAELEL